MSHHASYRTFNSIPATVVTAHYEPHLYSELADMKTATGLTLWSGMKPIPSIGEVVHCYMNSIGDVRIIGYFNEHGYFGVLAEAISPPEWLRRQNPEGNPTHLFGCDFDPRRVQAD